MILITLLSVIALYFFKSLLYCLILNNYLTVTPVYVGIDYDYISVYFAVNNLFDSF